MDTCAHHLESYTRTELSQWYSYIAKVIPKTSFTIQLHTTAERERERGRDLLRKKKRAIRLQQYGQRFPNKKLFPTDLTGTMALRIQLFALTANVSFRVN
jgi:hypothetical protein